MSKIWVLGAGQLGAMLKQAANPLGLDVTPVDIDSDTTLPLQADDIVTAEREAWPQTRNTDQLAAHPNFINLATFPQLADRLTQKQWLDRLNLATAPWQPVTTDTQALALLDALGPQVLLKRRTGGYDGRGQHWLRQEENPTIPAGWHDAAIAEQGIAFDEEVSLVGVRGKSGECYFFPLTLNLHVNGILYASIAPLERLSHLQPQAEKMLATLMHALDYVGVMAMECFRLGDKLLINELAPRVHNSGHWTQAGASISQFEYHMRAISELPLTQAHIKDTSLMLNLIGTPFDTKWLQTPAAELYWYQKSVRPGRKLGHINFCCSDQAQIISALDTLQSCLDQPYPQVIAWVKANHPNIN